MNRRPLFLLLVVLLLLGSGPARAQVSLDFAPADTTVAPGEMGRLSVMIDGPTIDVRTVDIYVTYDTTIVASVAGGSGQAFIDSGFFLFDGFENDTPGQWHGYCVILGSTDWLTAPGELYWWDFQGLVEGSTPIIAVEAYLAAGDGTYYPDVVLDPANINVVDPASAAGDLPAPRTGLNAAPNPFNPATTLSFELADAGPVRLAVYDLRGHEVALVHAGDLTAGRHEFTWHGRDDAGRAQPAGAYLVQLSTARGVSITKVTMVK
jgi:hypothetical protein